MLTRRRGKVVHERIKSKAEVTPGCCWSREWLGPRTQQTHRSVSAVMV